MKTQTKTDMLKVPGATLYFEVRGSGPVLLTISGGPTDAGMFDGLATLLEDRYTIVAYDQRGHSRSTIEGEPSGDILQQHADDACALIESVSTEPVFVLGSSGGATIGLDLVARHGDRVRTLVAHEPPVMMLLPDADRMRQKMKEIDEAYRTQGVFAAMGIFGQLVEEGGPSYGEEMAQQEQPPEQAEMMARMAGNFEFFMAHELQAIGGYAPDIDALKATPSRIVVAGGKTSGEQAAFRSAQALADKLGIELTWFEGAHGGWGAPEEAFAERLDEILRGVA